MEAGRSADKASGIAAGADAASGAAASVSAAAGAGEEAAGGAPSGTEESEGSAQEAAEEAAEEAVAGALYTDAEAVLAAVGPALLLQASHPSAAAMLAKWRVLVQLARWAWGGGPARLHPPQSDAGSDDASGTGSVAGEGSDVESESEAGEQEPASSIAVDLWRGGQALGGMAGVPTEAWQQLAQLLARKLVQLLGEDEEAGRWQVNKPLHCSVEWSLAWETQVGWSSIVHCTLPCQRQHIAAGYDRLISGFLFSMLNLIPNPISN